MSLQALLVLVVGGIAGIAVLLHLTGQSRQRVLRDPDDALALWHDAEPTRQGQKALVSRSGHAALIHHREGLGLLWAMGQDVVARVLPAGRVRLTESRRTLTLHLDDFTAPHVGIVLDAEERRIWRDALKEVLS